MAELAPRRRSGAASGTAAAAAAAQTGARRAAPDVIGILGAMPPAGAAALPPSAVTPSLDAPVPSPPGPSAPAPARSTSEALQPRRGPWRHAAAMTKIPH
jgi:hypothetical protein